MLTPDLKNEIKNKLTIPSYNNGMSDTKWQKIAEKIASNHRNLTIEEIFEEYEKQFDNLLNNKKEEKTTMTREEMLNTMKGPELIKEADKLGVKVVCDKNRTKLTEAKAKVIERILAFEAEHKIEESTETTLLIPKRGTLIEWNGKAQNLFTWSKELGISDKTLYGRLYQLGWTVEKAFTTKGRNKR